MKHRFTSLTALSAAALITLSACGSSSGGGGGSSTAAAPNSAAAAPNSPAAAPSSAAAEATTEASSSPSAEDMAEHNDADIMFAQMMLPHHRQAVEMSNMLLQKDGIDPAATDLATRISAAQGPEIDQLGAWLGAWGEPEEPGHDMGSMGDRGSMEGMMSDEDMAALGTAEGVEAEIMFLESMTAHHRGAVQMAQQEIQDGMFPDAIAMAETIVKTQQAEIEEMTALLEQR